MTASGSYAFAPSLVDIVLDAFDRLQIRPAAITPDHMFSARRSLNLVYTRWANRGLNLWEMEEVSVQLNSGQQNYNCPAGTVSVMEVFSRTYDLGAAQDTTPAVSTTDTSTTVTLTLADHGLLAEQWVGVPISVSVGGIIISGFYQVVSVPSTSTFTITAASAATATVLNGGAVPVYATTADDATITMTLANHGKVAGEVWTVVVGTSVGGLYLFGEYTITSVTTDTLTFEATSPAGSTDSATENSGDMQIAVQAQNSLPQDRFLTPMSRTDWASQSSKFSTAQWPTTYWFNRQSSPQLTIWPIPVSTSPQELRYYRMRQIQDANPQNTETPDIPYRFEEALCADLAAHLAIKWKPESYDPLAAYAKEVWLEAALEDRERVPLNVSPVVQGYYP